MAQALTLLELSERSGEPVERLATWRSAGLIGQESTDLYTSDDLRRIRLTQFLVRQGFEVGTIAQAKREAGLVTSYVELLSSGDIGRTYSLEEASAKLGWTVLTIRSFLEAMGFTEQDAWIDDDDLRADWRRSRVRRKLASLKTRSSSSCASMSIR